MRYIKLLFFPVLFLLVYIVLLWTVFFGNIQLSEIGTTIGLQIILSSLLLFAVLWISSEYKKRIYLTILACTVFFSLVALLFYPIEYAIFIFGLHIILWLNVWQIYYYLDTTKSYYLLKMSNVGGRMLSLLFASLYTVIILIAGTGISLDCSDLHNQTVWLITRYIPSLESNTKLIGFVQYIEGMGSKTFGQLLWTWASKQTPLQSSPLTTGEISQEIIDSPGWVLSSLLIYQQSFIQGLISNQELIDAKVCDLTLSHIKDIMNSGTTQLIGFVLIIFLLSLFMSSVMLVVTVLNFVLLLFLFKIKWFTIKKHKGDCEKIVI